MLSDNSCKQIAVAGRRLPFEREAAVSRLHSNRGRSTAGFAVVCLILAAAAPATAAPTWVEPTPLSSGPTDNYYPVLAMTPEGATTAVWGVDDLAGETMVMTAHRAAGGLWTSPEALADVNDPGVPRIGAAADGTVVAVWDEQVPSEGVRGVFARTRSPGGSWDAAARLSEVGVASTDPRIAMSPGGVAVVVWSAVDDITVIQAIRRAPGGAWSLPVTLSSLSEASSSPEVAVDADGDATAVWRTTDGGSHTVRTAYRPAGGGWQDRDTLSQPNGWPAVPKVIADPAGNVTAGWLVFDGANRRVQVAHRPMDGFWRSRRTLSAAGQDASEPQLAVDLAGAATVVWDRFDGTNRVIQASRRVLGGQWQTPVLVSDDTDDASYPAVASGPAGTVVVVFKGGGSNRMQGRRLAGDVWEDIQDLSDFSGFIDHVLDVAMDEQGNAIAAWSQMDGTFHVQSAGFDAAAPTPLMTKPTKPFSLAAVPVGWQATDVIGPVMSYRVRVRSALPNGPFGDPATWLASTSFQFATYAGDFTGRTYCFTVRAKDLAANTSSYSAERCSAQPLDERELTRSTGWVNQAIPAAYRGTARTATAAGEKLVSDTVLVRRVALVATTAPGAGSVDVYLGATKLGSVSLASATTKRRQVIPLATLPSRTTGKIRIVTTTADPVTIEGLGISAQ